MIGYDHQEVRLIAITRPEADAIVEEHDPAKMSSPDAEDLIAYCARVSNPSNQSNFDTAHKLLNYCIKKQHWSIFEMVNVVLEVKTTRDIGRQILRHRFAFQEFSQRYAKVDTNSFVIREARFQDMKNRQNSIPLSVMQEQSDHSPELLANAAHVCQEWERRQKEIQKLVTEHYEWAISNNIAKEQARCILPEGNTMSCMYINGTLRNWFHYTLLRMAPGTQREHQDIAEKAFHILQDKFDFLKEIEVQH